MAFSDGSVAFRHDLFNGLPPDFDQCDVFYADPPWMSGFEVFNARANVSDGRTYRQFAQCFASIVASLRVPAFITFGAGAANFMPQTGRVFPIRLNGNDCWCYAYNNNAHRVALTADELLADLAANYECVGDPVCGYGRAARFFRQAGKRFVVSDYNATCIGAIAREFQ